MFDRISTYILYIRYLYFGCPIINNNINDFVDNKNKDDMKYFIEIKYRLD